MAKVYVLFETSFMQKTIKKIYSEAAKDDAYKAAATSLNRIVQEFDLVEPT